MFLGICSATTGLWRGSQIPNNPLAFISEPPCYSRTGLHKGLGYIKGRDSASLGSGVLAVSASKINAPLRPLSLMM